MKVTVCGDFHASFTTLTALAKKEQPDIILQCGDFGYHSGEYLEHIAQYNEKALVYFCRGNHENHDLLDENYSVDTGNMSGIYALKENPKIHLCNAGSLLTLKGIHILFLGGAYTTKRDPEKERVSWWQQEVISEACKNAILHNAYPNIDMIIAHTAPSAGLQVIRQKFIEKHGVDRAVKKKIDGKTQLCSMPPFLQQCVDTWTPDYFFHGHFHISAQQSLQHTQKTTQLISLADGVPNFAFPDFYKNIEISSKGISFLEQAPLTAEEQAFCDMP